MEKSECITGKVVAFPNREGGYLNYCANIETNEHNFTEQEAETMLSDFNDVISKHFPWMRDFVIFQLEDNTIRLDVADRQFLGAGGSEY